MWKLTPTQFLAAIALDLLLGDPQGWPHPARITGAVAKLGERWFRAWSLTRTVFGGALFWLLIVTVVSGIYVALFRVAAWLHPAAAWLFSVWAVYQCIAITDLKRHVYRVLRPLRDGDLPAAREALLHIVGRDTMTLPEHEVSRAAIECVAESTCDGIVAPLFWAAFAGWPGALIYRVANTLDSMVGYRDETYEFFGKASARIDDALNWIPARLAAVCYAWFGALRHWRAIRREARTHASPNAGWPEAAVAYALGVKLGGENSYAGVHIVGPIFNPAARAPICSDIARSLSLMGSAVAVACAILLLIRTALNFI